MLAFFHAVRPQSAAAFPELTEREREVLALIAHGKSNGDIARELTVSMKTVRNHVSNVLGKLQVAARAQAAIRGREAGLFACRDAGTARLRERKVSPTLELRKRSSVAQR